MNPFFSIVIVCYQAGEELKKTLSSVLTQSERDFEVIIKDGGSTDGSLSALPADSHIRIFCGKDAGIYDAMNQAAGEVTGRYVLFLNCGDYLYDDAVLADMRTAIGQHAKAHGMPAIFYGNTYERKTESLVMSNPKLDAFGCYRNVPCHQSCFYDARLILPEQLKSRGRRTLYESQYRVRADYEHFLWCFFRAGAETVYVSRTVCSYEGGGYSESPANRAQAKKEHREITALYMTKGQRLRYRAILLLTLAPLRTKLAGSRRFSGIYQGIKRALYRCRTNGRGSCGSGGKEDE